MDPPPSSRRWRSPRSSVMAMTTWDLAAAPDPTRPATALSTPASSTPAADHPRLWRNEAAGRYELSVEEEIVAVAHFVDQGGLTVVPHTEVAPTRRGQGIGAVLVGGVLEDLRARGQKVVPQCWYVRQFIEEHPDYSELIAP